jgi:hypothetical protein
LIYLGKVFSAFMRLTDELARAAIEVKSFISMFVSLHGQ